MLSKIAVTTIPKQSPYWETRNRLSLISLESQQHDFGGIQVLLGTLPLSMEKCSIYYDVKYLFMK